MRWIGCNVTPAISQPMPKAGCRLAVQAAQINPMLLNAVIQLLETRAAQ
jgi:hypothetical protein